jgi:hypothetical protein
MKIEDKNKVINELAELRYKRGWSRSSLVKYLNDTYKLELSRSYELIRDMMQEVADTYHKTNPDALSDSIQFMEEMKQKAIGAGNDKLALEWSKEIHKVSQLYVEKVMIEAKGIEAINITIKGDDKKEGGDAKDI